MQAAFFKLSNVIPYEVAEKEMKKAIDKSYGRKGEDVVKKNYAAIDRSRESREGRGSRGVKALAGIKEEDRREVPEFIKKIVEQ
jgi:pyruvate-ferredoxin/flavodoxin oxidoreductase